MGFRVLVCGGRDFNDRDFIHNTLCDLDAERGPITCVIHGCATGADHEGMIWAQMMASIPGRTITQAPFAAEWDNIDAPGAVVKNRRGGGQYNVLAGFWRNQRMIDEGKPDLVLAFPGGNGTADTIARARKAGIEVIEAAP